MSVEQEAQPPVSSALRSVVVGLCMVAAVGLTNPYFALFRLRHELVGGAGASMGGADPTLRVTVLVGIAAVLLALLVMRYAPGTGWAWLVLGGLAVGALVMVVFAADPPGMLRDARWLLGVLVAGPLLIVLGLLGAGNWLMHAAGVASGGPVAAAPFVVPLLPIPLLVPLLVDVDGVTAWTVAAVVASLAAAIGLVALGPVLRRVPTPAPPTMRLTVLGAIAGVLIAVPELLARIGWDDQWFSYFDPASDNPLAAREDEWILRLGIAGLLILVAALALGALAGVRALAAALGAGLVLYGVTRAVAVFNPAGLVPFGDSSLVAGAPVTVTAFLAGALLGMVAAQFRWHYWLAGGACAVVGVVVAAAVIGGGQVVGFQVVWLPEPWGAVMLAAVAVALTATVIGAASALRTGTQLAVVLGLLAVAIRTGLDYSETMVRHSAIAGRGGTAPFTVAGVVAGIALLFGGLLIVALHRMPDAPKSEPAEPVEPEPVASGVEHQQ